MNKTKKEIPYVRYGKSSVSLFDSGFAFYDPQKQDSCLEENHRVYEIYKAQPLRKACKNCGTAIGPVTFIKYDINYHLCDNCGHLNGAYEDTKEYYRDIFTENANKYVAAHYGVKNSSLFNQRVENIYKPKVNFLFECLKADGIDTEALSYADFGAGSGYLVKALLDAGIKQVSGYEASYSQVKYGNEIIGRDYLQIIEMDEIEQIAATIDVNVISMVFVLEHLMNPSAVFEAFSKNPSIQYILIAVPVHSLSCYIELMFPSVYQRQLSSHTHLYSDKSLNFLCDSIGLDRIGEWWFGSDMIDLFRSFRTRMFQTNQPEAASKDWEKMMLLMLDSLQLEVGKRKLSSEVHLVLKTRR